MTDFTKVDEEFERLDYLFHDTVNGDVCDSQRNYSVNGEILKCNCGGEKRKEVVKSFLHSKLEEAVREERKILSKPLIDFVRWFDPSTDWFEGSEEKLKKLTDEYFDYLSTLTKGERE